MNRNRPAPFQISSAAVPTARNRLAVEDDERAVTSRSAHERARAEGVRGAIVRPWNWSNELLRVAAWPSQGQIRCYFRAMSPPGLAPGATRAAKWPYPGRDPRRCVAPEH